MSSPSARPQHVASRSTNLLAFDTSTDTMSIALQRGTGKAVTLFQHTAAGGAQTSTHLIPEIQRLMALAQLHFADLNAIVFGAGPGSFTGLRTACSVAQGLAFGAAVPVLPVDTLLAVAEEARWQTGNAQTFAVTALLDARMDELYTADYSFDLGAWTQGKSCRLIKPEQLGWNGSDVLAGNVFDSYGARLPGQATRITALPTATALLRLAPALLAAGAAVPAEQALPTYIRDKVAQTTQERVIAKALAGVAP
ncbi:MAG: tRNA (adenosine(37)-N6)-threonylcarbamoyltransferase complex dimerization subunit type 1 TsaB [Betaproteobacteria bacterium HGW-Betaproteobacteria-18]|nr:MAG: tRNA (adenosine(37)-N6)-threonylcarbamoyltransferase complex dimerization subunit type 1 TsaB [Betaproteobacteria bacterium HGW-Betaproteobacteria-18]